MENPTAIRKCRPRLMPILLRGAQHKPAFKSVERSTSSVRDRRSARFQSFRIRGERLSRACFATQEPSRLDRLVLYGPVTLRRQLSPKNEQIPAYTFVTEEQQ